MGAFKQISQLGKGKFSSTFLVENEKGELFVVKKLKELHSDVELDINLNVKGVQRTLHYTDNLLVKQYFEGTLLNSEKLTKLQKLEACLVLLGILEELHKNNVVHADIKPSNVIVGESTVLLDLGLAILIDAPKKRKTRYAMIYAPPELVLNKLDVVAPASDIYSLCAVIYEIIVGSPIHAGETPSHLINQMLAHPIDFSSKIHPELRHLLKTALAKPDFKVPPNKLQKQELIEVLKENIKDRAVTMQSLKTALTLQIEHLKKPFYKRLLY